MFKSKTRFEKKTNDYAMNDEWVLDTNGNNMLGMMLVPHVDQNRLISNDIYEMYELLGIEAVRQVLMNEMNDVIKGAGSYVNYRHLSMLVDIMTNRGTLMSIDRFGINRETSGHWRSVLLRNQPTSCSEQPSTVKKTTLLGCLPTL